MCKRESDLEKDTYEIVLDIEIHTDHRQTKRPNDNYHKRRTCRIMNFTVREEHKMKSKENQKND